MERAVAERRRIAPIARDGSALLDGPACGLLDLEQIHAHLGAGRERGESVADEGARHAHFFDLGGGVQLKACRRLGETLRRARGTRTLNEVAAQAGLSPETLRKIETGRLPSPAFGTVAAFAAALDLSLDALAREWTEVLPRIVRRA